MGMMYFLFFSVIFAAAGIYVYNHLSGRNLLKDRLDALRLAARSLSTWDTFWAQNARRSDIIVCLTTTPKRIAHLEQTLKSLMYQSRRPRRIRVHIPLFSKREKLSYQIPAYLHDLRSVDIVRCEDYGPATKLLPALQTLPADQKIIVIDDDMLYPRHMVDDFFRWSNQYPNITIASSGWIVPQDLTDRPTTLLRNLMQTPPTPIISTRIKHPRRVDILQGYSGFLIKPEFFAKDGVFDYSQAPEAAFFVDDVWISAHCRVPKFIYPARRFCFESLRHARFFKRSSLGLLNRGGGDIEKRNNTIMIRHFKDRWG